MGEKRKNKEKDHTQKSRTVGSEAVFCVLRKCLRGL